MQRISALYLLIFNHLKHILSGFYAGRKRLQARLQTFATRDASICVPEDNRLSASENAFFSSYFDVR